MGDEDGLALEGELSGVLEAVLAVGSDLDLVAVLRRIVATATTLVDARYGALGVLDPTGSRLVEFIPVGLGPEEVARIGRVPEGHGLLGLLIRDARPIRYPDLNTHPESSGFPPGHPPMTSFLGVPLHVRDQVFGNLYLTDKRSGGEFTEADEHLVVGLAAAAGVAIENTRLQARVQDLALIEDRERIARDLHDTVIQRLFASGLSLHGVSRLVRGDPDEAARRVESVIDELDLTVKEIRTAIFELENPPSAVGGLRQEIATVIRDLAEPAGLHEHLRFDGLVDTMVGDDLATDVVATVREAVSNVVRHAAAHEVTVEVKVGPEVRVRVLDDGIGVVERQHAVGTGRGLPNLTTRARQRGGSLVVEPRPGGGTALVWTVPNPT